MEQVSTEEVKRRTERVGKEIDEVIEVSEGSLAVVAKCVRDVNETLAIHAAWTDERFDQVESRLSGIERGQLALQHGQSALSLGQAALMQKLDRLDGKFEAPSERAVRAMDRLTARVDELLDFVIRKKLNAEKDTKQ